MDHNVADAYRRGDINVHFIAFNYWHAAENEDEAIGLIADALKRIPDSGYVEEEYQSQRFVKDQGKWLSKDEVGTYTQEFIANKYELLMEEVKVLLD